MEIINNKQITPHRLHALVRLVPRLRNPNKESLLNLVQPPDLINSQDAGKAVYNAAIRYNLITEDKHGTGHISLHETIGSPKNIESIESFRCIMQNRLTGISNEWEDNYLLNFVTAWYAVQNERVFRFHKKKEIRERFNESIDVRDEADRMEEGRILSDEKLLSWLVWASFLGWGQRMKIGSLDLLIPNAYNRIKNILPKLFSDQKEIPIIQFMNNLSEVCPELDGGSLFEQCWQASRGAEIRGNQMSLMLSTSLRAFVNHGEIALTHLSDAIDTWQFFPAQGYPSYQVTHIQLKV